MKNIQEEQGFLKQLMDMLEKQLGDHTEIVLHDLTADYASTIVDIRNGHVTGRKIGGTGSNLGLEVLAGTVKNGDRYNYITKLKDNRILRSSSLYIKDPDGRVIGSICINSDITESVRFEGYLKEIIQYNTEGNGEDKQEVFVSDVNQLLEYLLQEGQKMIGKPALIMTKEEKMRFLKYLNGKGAFLITKSGERVQEFLGISKYTMYSYLEAIKKEQEE